MTDPTNQGLPPQAPTPQQPTYPSPPPYPPAGYAQPQTYAYLPVTPPTDGFSVAALVLGILGFNIIAIIFGIIGLNRTADGRYSGRGFAIAGIVLGAVYLVAIILAFIFFFSIMGAALATG
ncbi:DUF4190 domain-containing protein [Scrofimicrobium sp. R131]|uniref:DUF4190 domain-containing protein n=1 Tax=Scrofimicrobium appendicitidis TaxID=3079930 RepID=A0AAU7V699_9ACTO